MNPRDNAAVIQHSLLKSMPSTSSSFAIGLRFSNTFILCLSSLVKKLTIGIEERVALSPLNSCAEKVQ